MNSIELIREVIDYIEKNLYDKIYLEEIAEAVHYSKYYIHRIFSNVLGMTIHEYVKRRRLTEAARLLVTTEKSILEIALIACYGSQQAFSTVFKQMYKKSPKQFRQEGNFYALENKCVVFDNVSTDIDYNSEFSITYVKKENMEQCIEFVSQVVDGLPCFNQNEFNQAFDNYICEESVLMMQKSQDIVGIIAFNRKDGFINFWEINRQYRKKQIETLFLERVREEIGKQKDIGITTFREGDPADKGFRKNYKELGFIEADKLIEYGYPTQKMILRA